MHRGEPVARRNDGRAPGDVTPLLHDLAAHGDLGERPAPRQQPLARRARGRATVQRPGRAREGPPQDQVGPLAQVAVDCRTAVALDARQEQQARHGIGDRKRADRRDRDPDTQAVRRRHARSAQPTPRTVWRMRGSPSPSSLRRR